MFEHLPILPLDSILGLAVACRADANPDKVDLTVGIYRDESGVCPVFDAVKRAQRQLIEEEVTKAYISPQGDRQFIENMAGLVLGAERWAERKDSVAAVQTPGGCGAVRLGAEVLQVANPRGKVWLSDPSWPVHKSLITSVGLEVAQYRYYDPTTYGVNFDAMLEDLKAAGNGDVVLFHGCCHNPSGADLSVEQWVVMAEMATAQGFTPMIDLAYQGFGDGLDADVFGVRAMIDNTPEVIVAASLSKNMGLYRERVGLAMYIGPDARTAEATESQAKAAARRIYSMPPAHGAIIAGKVLGNPELRANWEAELIGMRERINGLRIDFRDRIQEKTGRDFSFIGREKGMFSFLGLTEEQTQQARVERGLYMLDSSRINVAGLNAGNIDKVVESVASVI